MSGARSTALLLGSFIVTTFGSPSTAPAQINPEGWIRPEGWTILLPLIQDGGCSGGGEASLADNWLAPHRIELEDPRPGETWGDIDFGGEARALRWGGEGLWTEPTWLSYTFLQETHGIPGEALPAGDALDFLGLVDGLNAYLLWPLGLELLSGQDVLAVATTYVLNTAPGSKEIEICTASDDSLQVWLNNQLITQVSACRPLAAGCDDARVAILPPGISKITALVWQGDGPWSLRLGLRENGILLRDDPGGEAAPEVLFLGSGEGEPGQLGQALYELERTHDLGSAPCPAPSVGVTLRGNIPRGSPASPDDTVLVVEEVTARRPEGLAVSSVSPPTEVVELHGSGRTADGFITSWLLLGPFYQGGGAAPGEERIRLDYLSDGAVGERDVFPRSGDIHVPDYGGAAASTGVASGREFNAGGLPRWASWQDSDDTIELGEYYRDELDGIVQYAVTYIFVEEELVADIALASDDSVQVLLDGEEVFIRDVGRGYGPSGTIQDTISGVFFPAGEHVLLVKVFDGGLEHGFRLRLQDPDSGAPLTSGYFVCTEPTEEPGVACNPAGRKITWEVSRDRVGRGLSYRVSSELPTGVRPSARVTNSRGEVEMLARGAEVLPLDPAAPGGVGAFLAAHDIGRPALAGSTIHDPEADAYTLSGAGRDIWNGGDQFHFAYLPVTGDFDLQARITARLPPLFGGRWGKHGLMARHGCEPTAKYTMIQTQLSSPGVEIDHPRHTVRLRHGHAAPNLDLSIVDDGILSDRQPPWMRLRRIGDTIYSFLAEDEGGTPGPWLRVGSDSDRDRPPTLLAGMALTSHAPQQTGTITFDRFEVNPVAPASYGAACAPGELLLEASFTGGNGEPPAGATVATGSGHVPVVEGGRLRLARQGVILTASAVWFQLPSSRLGDEGFLAEFDAFAVHSLLGIEPNADPGDGLTLAVIERGSGAVDSPFPEGLDIGTLVGDAGGNLGYCGGTIGQRAEGHGSFAVELDLWQNTGVVDLSNDPPVSGSPYHDGRWHVGLDESGSARSTQSMADRGVEPVDLPDLFSPHGVHVEVEYRPAPTGDEARVVVRVSSNDGSGTPLEVISARIHELRGEILFGFTAGTGIASATLEVDDLRVHSLCCQGSASTDIVGPDEVIQGESVRLAAVISESPPGATPAYRWRITRGLGQIIGSSQGAAVDVQCDDTTDVTVELEVALLPGCPPVLAEHTVSCLPPPSGAQRPSDCNQDGRVDISDALCLFGHLFLGDPRHLPCGPLRSISLLDHNGDGQLDRSDGIAILVQLFLGGPPHPLGRSCLPLPGCGESSGCTQP